MQLDWLGRVSTGRDDLDEDLRDLQIVPGSSGPVLYTLSGSDGGIGRLAVSDTGLASSLAPLRLFTDRDVSPGSWKFVTAETSGGETYLLLDAGQPGNVSLQILDAGAGPSGPFLTPALPGDVRIGELAAHTVSDTRLVLYVTDAQSGLLSGYFWDRSDPGRVEAITGLPPVQPTPALGTHLTSLSAGGRDFLLLAGENDGLGGLTSYRIDPATGQLEIRGTAGPADGLAFAGATALAGIEALGTTWVVLAGADSQSLSVLELLPNGALRVTDHVTDTLSTRFGETQALALLEAEGQIFVAAAGGDDGVNLFTLLPDGQLLHLSALPHDTDLGLANITDLSLVRTGDALALFAASDTGIVQLSADLGLPGVQIRDTASTGDRLSGTAGRDLILAGPGGRDTLIGGEAADILVAGRGGSDLRGGAGADLFVVREASDLVRVLDFSVGEDRLDLSLLPFLRSPAQLSATPQSDGILLRFGATDIRLISSDGAPLSLDDLWRRGQFDWPDRFPVDAEAPAYVPPPEGPVRGGAGNDTIMDTDGDDILIGGAGADVFLLRPGMGRDTIADFEPGVDRLDFSAFPPALVDAMRVTRLGDDRVLSIGPDTVVTLAGRGLNFAPEGGVAVRGLLGVGEVLRTENGLRDMDGLGPLSYQWLRNGARISGATNLTLTLSPADLGARISVEVRYVDGLGTSEIVRSPATAPVVNPVTLPDGITEFTGSPGRDFLRTGGGQDIVRGGQGDDTLTGSDDAELLDGGPGNDVLLSFQGNNTVYSGPGNDYVETRLGADTVWGGPGNDTLFAGGGNDRVGGFDGQDVIGGGTGNDELWGGRGNDVVFGATGNDTVAGSVGNDNLWGGPGDDLIFGAPGNDTIAGASGADTIWLGDGADLAFGSDGADLIIGLEGNDTIYGGAGADTITAGTGNDLIYGVDGPDQFVMRPGDGDDRIVDFEPGVDQITLTGTGARFATLELRSDQGGTLIDYGSGTIRLDSLDPQMLDAGDFVFS